ncbi:MAG: hypothetical protein R3C42_09605 [Parvularculaceae bacterium]
MKFRKRCGSERRAMEKSLKLELFRQEIDLYINETLSDAARSKFFVGYSQEAVAAFEKDWNSATEGRARFELFADGRRIESIASAAGSSVISERVKTLGLTVSRALELFDLFTKVVTGDYKSQTFIYVNGGEIQESEADQIPSEAEVVIVNMSPFARKAEKRGFNDADSSGFKNGLFESIAAILKQEATVPVRFAFDGKGAGRLPAIIIGGRG